MVKSPQTAKRKKPRRPRAPLPRQRGGAHEDKTKRPDRQRKHRKPEVDAACRYPSSPTTIAPYRDRAACAPEFAQKANTSIVWVPC